MNFCKLSGYHTMYLALELNFPLATLDRTLAHAARKAGVSLLL